MVHARLGDFEGRSSLRTWLYGIALRVALANRRKGARRHEALTDAPPEIEVAAEQHDWAARRQTVRLIERALSALSEDKREVFVLYELEGMTMAEVAAALAVPENTALYRLYAARDEVRASLRQHEHSVRPRAPLSISRTLP